MKRVIELFRNEIPELFDNIRLGMMFVNEEKNIIHANRSFLRMFESTLKDICGQKCCAVIHPNSPECKHCDDHEYINLNVNICGKTCSLLISSSRRSKDVLLKIIHDVTRLLGEVTELKEELIRLKVLVGSTVGLSEKYIVCSNCGKIRLNDGSWVPATQAGKPKLKQGYSHGQCPDCSREYLKNLYPSEEEGEVNEE